MAVSMPTDSWDGTGHFRVAQSNVLLDTSRMGLQDVLARVGLSDAELGSRLGVSAEAVRLWRSGARRISPVHVKKIELDFNIPRHELRPDIYDAPNPAVSGDAA